MRRPIFISGRGDDCRLSSIRIATSMKLHELKKNQRAVIVSPPHWMQERGLIEGAEIEMIKPGETSIIKVGCTVLVVRADLEVAPVAQWIEHGISNPRVAGSNPAGGTE